MTYGDTNHCTRTPDTARRTPPGTAPVFSPALLHRRVSLEPISPSLTFPISIITKPPGHRYPSIRWVAQALLRNAIARSSLHGHPMRGFYTVLISSSRSARQMSVYPEQPCSSSHGEYANQREIHTASWTLVLTRSRIMNAGK